MDADKDNEIHLNKASGVKPPPLPETPPQPPKKDYSAKYSGVTVEEQMGLPVRWWDSLLLGLIVTAADVGIYKAPGGSGSGLLLAVSLFVLLASQRKWMNVAQLMLGGSVLAMAGLMVWHHWGLLYIVGWIALFVLSMKLSRPDWFGLDAFLAIFCTLKWAPMRFAGHFYKKNLFKRQHSSAATRKKWSVSIVLIPAAICGVFVLVFSAANPVISKMLAELNTGIADFFTNIGQYVSGGRILFWGLMFLLGAVLIRPVKKCLLADELAACDETLADKHEQIKDDSVFATSLVTLISVNILFAAYNAMDSVYLYFKATLPKGISWTDYTHQGCGWLTIALFFSSLVVGYIFNSRLNFHPRAKVLRWLAYSWSLLNGILAVGSLRRMQMYIDYSGLTHLRITGVLGTLLVASGMGIMVYKIYAGRNSVWLLRRYVLAFGIAVLTLALIPSGYICATYNVQKVQEYKPRALRPIFLKELSPEALPPLIELLDYKRADGDVRREKLVREGIAAILGQHLEQLEKKAGVPWSQRQLSADWALKKLRPVREKIQKTLPEYKWEAARRRMINNPDMSRGQTGSMLPGATAERRRRIL
jgi:hypothetical protein